MHPKCISVFPEEEDYKFERILEEDMKIHWSMLDGAFCIAEHRTSLSPASAIFALDSDNLPVHMTLSSESPFLRRSLLTQRPLLLSRLQP